MASSRGKVVSKRSNFEKLDPMESIKNIGRQTNTLHDVNVGIMSVAVAHEYVSQLADSN